MATIPGATAKHLIIRDGCRAGHGDMGAFEKAVSLLREEYGYMLPNWPAGNGTQFHLVLTLERPVEAPPVPVEERP